MSRLGGVAPLWRIGRDNRISLSFRSYFGQAQIRHRPAAPALRPSPDVPVLQLPHGGVFGFGPGKQEDLGEVAPTACPNCHNQVFLHHVQSKKSVRLYFVPVVPYGTDHYLICPICSRGLQVD